jgi:hypothetical protein
MQPIDGEHAPVETMSTLLRHEQLATQGCRSIRRSQAPSAMLQRPVSVSKYPPAQVPPMLIRLHISRLRS